MERLARDPLYFSKPDRALFQDIRRYFPIRAQAQVAWVVEEGVGAAVAFISEQIEAGAFDGGAPALPRDDSQGQAVPAHAAAGAGLLPVASAPGNRGRGVALGSHTPGVRVAVAGVCCPRGGCLRGRERVVDAAEHHVVPRMQARIAGGIDHADLR